MTYCFTTVWSYDGCPATTNPSCHNHITMCQTGQLYDWLWCFIYMWLKFGMFLAFFQDFLLVSGKKYPFKSVGLLNNWGVHLMTAMKKARMSFPVIWVPWLTMTYDYSSTFNYSHNSRNTRIRNCFWNNCILEN